MNSFKQALNQLNSSWKNSLILGALATFFIFLIRYIPWGSAFVMSFGILIFQEVARNLVVTSSWRPHSQFLRKEWIPYLITSLILLPTSVLLGSALGILESPQTLLATAPMSLGLLILAVYFYLVLSQALRLHSERNESLAKAIDIVGLASLKNFRLYFTLSFYFGLLILISGMTKGVGLLVTLPLLFYANHFAYVEMNQRGFTAPVRQ
ncbi:MAG: hypothetical protein KUL82_05310 [Bdellovibrio sp.]|nr:hypothetical protein [Bdellovibrio sp.]